MIEVTIMAVTQGQPVVTTPESINERAVNEVMAPIAARLMELVGHVTGVFPATMTITIDWADGTAEPDKKEEPESMKYSSPSVPKHFS